MKDVLAWKKNLEANYKGGKKLKDEFGFPVVARNDAIHMTLFNSRVQGTASRMIFHGSLMANNEFNLKNIDAKPLLWVHDEVVWRFPITTSEEDCMKIVDHYMTCYKLDTQYGVVPLAVEGHTADRWQK
jgi:DNA polymerase I-like protein with 3'-5' exonuclease and polymerase domains